MVRCRCVDIFITPVAFSLFILVEETPLDRDAAREPSNLQLQDTAESYRRDRLEKKLQCLVCTGQVPLSEARTEIAKDWQAAYHRFAQIKCRRGSAIRFTEATSEN